MSTITTHILDVSSGVPARGVSVTLEQETSAGWEIIGKGETDDDGRLRDLLDADAGLQTGNYRLTFDTGNYFFDRQIDSFYPNVTVAFTVISSQEHYHVPSVAKSLRLFDLSRELKKIMSAKMVHNSYGKSRVRLLKVARNDDRHEIQNITVRISLEGDFTAAHKDGDNSHILPTDTMKNTVYVLANQRSDIEEIESFALRLAKHFLTNNYPVTWVSIEIAEHVWERMSFEGEPHLHSFIKGSNEKHFTKEIATGEKTIIESGLEDLIVLKTTNSGFVGFIKDEYTTLPEETDRILSTSIKAIWRYADPKSATESVRHDIRQTIIETFAGHNSHSVQHTLWVMGETVLEKFSEIEEIFFSLPNIHFLPVDMTRFGLTNNKRIFLPTDEPHGLIEARIKR